MTYAYSNSSKTAIIDSDGKCIPVCTGNRDYDALIEEGTVISDSFPTLEDQLAAIESEYAPKISALQTALVAATLTDGSIMDGNVSSLRAEWAALLNAKSEAMEALLI